MATTPSPNLEELITNSMNEVAEKSTIEEIQAPLSERKVLEEKKEPEEKKTVETKGEEESELDDLGLTKEEQKQARQLLAGLKDPGKAPVILEHLMRVAGIEKPETKKEVKEVKKALVEQLKDSLGPELSYLADKMGPVFQSFLDEKLTEVQEKNETRFTEVAIERETKIAATAQEELAQEFFETKELPSEFVSEVGKLIDEYKPRAGQSTKSYLKDMLHLASGRLGKPLSKQTAQITQKAEKNRTDAASRLASAGNKQPLPGREVSTRTEVPKAMSIDEAIRIGLESTNALFQTTE